MKYVIYNDERKQYVASSSSSAGDNSSYTKYLQKARTWNTREAAKFNLCPGNERVISLEDAVPG